MSNAVLRQLIKSWETVFTDSERQNVLEWVAEKNRSIKTVIKKIPLSESDFWFYDEERGDIRNKNNSFFQIRGLQKFCNKKLAAEQPIIIQGEIGFLGILCKEIDGVLKFLMQAKIEPGNVNKIQISPTIQATKSNFLQKHGGAKPLYLEYFLNAKSSDVIVDQIQSEQSSRFLGKRNRNIIIKIDNEIEATPNHIWLTLGQLKELLKIDNLVNMDTRTVISCLPFSMFDPDESEKTELWKSFRDKALFHSIFDKADHNDLIRAYQYINDYKMFQCCETRLVPLKELKSWRFSENGISHQEKFSFDVIYCDIQIEGREVSHWTQPMFEALGSAIFGLITTEINGRKKFLIHAVPEVGCFDQIEFAPTVQIEPGEDPKHFEPITKLFFKLLENKTCVKTDIMLSEEGGRFYCEQNRNLILDVPKQAVEELPAGYFWLDYKTLNYMVQFNNCLNIQLRNLISLLEI